MITVPEDQRALKYMITVPRDKRAVKYSWRCGWWSKQMWRRHGCGEWVKSTVDGGIVIWRWCAAMTGEAVSPLVTRGSLCRSVCPMKCFIAIRLSLGPDL
eukprot:6105012-Prymnesium_polylepis.1